MRSALNWAFRSKSLPLWLLAVLLIAHLAIRIHLQSASTLARAHNYPRTYAVALSLLGGHGFADLAIDDSPTAAPLHEFLEMSRRQLSADELSRYFATTHRPDRDPETGLFGPLTSTRVLDLRLAAILWRVFGVRWAVLSVFYCLLSTVTCALIFQIARQLSGSAWGGLAGAVLFACSPIEAFLNTWSWRDASPMWFTAAALAWFVSGTFPSSAVGGAAASSSGNSATRRWLLWSAVLGFLAMLGIGWRSDALLLPPFLAAALATRLVVDCVGWRRAGVALAGFAAAALGVWFGVRALGPATRQDESIGFHMAAYADFSRANLLEIENSFQAMFSDMQVLRTARQIGHAEHPESPPLEYLSPAYGRVCKQMFFEELNYNVFHWVFRSPLSFYRILSGLDTDSATQQLGSKQILDDVPRAVRPLFQAVDFAGHVLPWFFLLGGLGALVASPQRLSAAVLLAFSVYYATILFLVLPEQKHLGPLLVPLYALSGVGLWLLPRLLIAAAASIRSGRQHWQTTLASATPGPIRQLGVGLVATAAVWGLASVVAYYHSVAARQRLIAEIQSLAARGTAAPETLRGQNAFAVQIAPGGPHDATGYLLKIEAGAYPNTLACRQITFPRDWNAVWGRAMITYHRLYPNREQYFFVSCLQGGEQGDPRPYLCSVEIHGDARIAACTHVDLSHWIHPQMATLFHADQRSPGSPREGFRSCDWMFVGLRALADSVDSTSESHRLRPHDGGTPSSSSAEPTATVPPGATSLFPLRHLAAHSALDGSFQVAVSDGWQFTRSALNYWAPATRWSQLAVGDFNGDGLEDFVGQTTEGQWWWAICDGAYHGFKPLAGLPEGVRCDFVGVGDFNGDGLDDLAIRAADGRWWLALNNGNGFDCRRAIPPLPSDVPAENLIVGDFLGNGTRQIAGLDPKTGRWTLGATYPGNWTVQPWLEFAPQVQPPRPDGEPEGREEAAARSAWQHPLAGDFLDSGQGSVAAWNAVTGHWNVGSDDGDGNLTVQDFGDWPADVDWKTLHVGRFGDSRAAGMVALDAKTGDVVLATSDGRKFTTRRFPGHPSLKQHLFVGDFSGLGHDQLLGLAADGQLWLGTLGTEGLKFEPRGRWPDAEHCADFRVIGFWPQGAATIRR